MKNILLIDINRRFRTELGNRLSAQGYEVREAHGGLDGINAYYQHPADAVVVELFLPEMDGLEIIMNLKRISPSMPIIAVAEPTVFTNVLGIASKLGATGSILKDNCSDVENICHILSRQLPLFSEKRLHPRFKVNLQGRLIPIRQKSECQGADCTIIDLSLGGVGLALCENDSLQLIDSKTDFLLELKTDVDVETVLHCANRRLRRDYERLLFGMEFAQLSEANLRQLKDIIS